MSFQWVFDTAESISINKRSVVGQTITRNLTVRATSRGTAPRRFTVKLPDGLRWSDTATYIQTIDGRDKFTTESIRINNPNYTSWIAAGDINPSTAYTVICVEMPEWTIFARDQVSWSGPFVFYEVL